jgi:predicted permease
MRRVFRIPFGRRTIARDVDYELAFHLETRAERLVAQGWPPESARREALRQFGDLESVRDSCVTFDEQRERTLHRMNVMSEMHQDVAYASRTLRRNAGFTAVIVGALALGIGANTAIFTLVDAVLVRTLPPPVSHAEQLVAIGNPVRVGSFSIGLPRTDLLSYPLYSDLRDQNRIFTGLFASGRTGRLDVRIDDHVGDGEFEHPHGRFVSGNYFAVLGVPAYAGRVFDASVDRVIGGSPVATISYGYWTRRFHNDRSVIGRAILVDGTKLTIIGVTPPSFTGEIVGAATDIWLPVAMHDALQPNQRVLDDRLSSWLLAMGRLRPGATLSQASSQIAPLMKQSIVSHSAPQVVKVFFERKPTYYVTSGAKGFSRVRDNFEAPLVTLMIGVALLLCIICANVANLLLARAIARGREMALRLALGANRPRLVRQLLTESAMLAALSAVVGLLIAWWGSRALLGMAASAGTVTLDLGLDVMVLAFTVTVSILAVALFGLVPALRASRVDLASAMRTGGPAVAGSAIGQRGQQAPLGRLLIAGQVAFSVVLLVGAAMLVRSLRNVQSIDVGLDRDHLVILDVDMRSRGYGGERLANLVHALRDRIGAVPGVAAVSYSENGVFSGTESATTVEVPGFVAHSVNDTVVAYDKVGPGYIRALGAHLLDGRDLLASDEGKPPRTALVNQSLATFYFPHERAVGKFIHFNDSIAIQVVGVLADTRDHSLSDEPPRRMYFPYAHTDTQPGQLDPPGTLRLEIRTAGDPTTVVQAVRRAVVGVDPMLPIDDVAPLVTLMQASIAGERLVARLATAFGLLALLLAAVGLYGVMTYTVTRRTGEIGLRVALGAQRANVVRMVLADATRLVGVGLLVGLPLAVFSARYLENQLHDVGFADPASIGLVVGILAASAVVAALIPAVRASRVSPLDALRAE